MMGKSLKVLILGVQCGLSNAIHNALKDKLEIIEAENFKVRTLKESSATLRDYQCEYLKPKGKGHTARQKREAKKRKNKR